MKQTETMKHNTITRSAFAISTIAFAALVLSCFATVVAAEQPIPKQDGKSADMKMPAASRRAVPEAEGAQGVQTITLDADKTNKTFDGIGAVSAGASSRLLYDYPEPQRNRIMDYLFKPKYGAGFQHLKVEIGGDINSTDGVEPSIARTRDEMLHPKPEYFNRGYEWWLMKEAKKRNPTIILDALQWGAPGWIGKGNFYLQDNADFIVAFIRGAKAYHDLDISYCGGWNERPYNVEWIKLLRRTLDAAGLRQVGIVAADEVLKWSIADKALNDPDLTRAIFAIGSHGNLASLPKPTSAALTLQEKGMRLWNSEGGEWDALTSTPWQKAMLRAATCNRNWVEKQLTKTLVWSPVTAYYDVLPAPGSGCIEANSPWSGSFAIQPSLWATAHTTQFVEPGWTYLESACKRLEKGGSVVALSAPDNRQLSVIIETQDATASQTVAFKPIGLRVDAFSVWLSKEDAWFVKLDDLKEVNGVFTITVPANAICSLTTLAGQRKGDDVPIPETKPFPLPYRDDFESYAMGVTARYLSDLGGAFEVARREDGGGQCLRQLIAHRGIDWVIQTPSPISVLGCSFWNNVEVSVDAALDEAPGDISADSNRYVGVVARFDMNRGRNNPWAALETYAKAKLSCYGLRLCGNGDWYLYSGEKVLVQGAVAKMGTAWHRLSLRCQDSRITAMIDGVNVADVQDTDFKTGLVGLESGLHGARFDNLAIAEQTVDPAKRSR